MDNKQPTVTVIIPLFNVYYYAERCIRSLMEQSYDALQILVIDDGSTDDVGELVQSLADEDERIYLITETNKGVSGARNAGLNWASGDYVTFVDGDDYVGQDYIADMVEAAVSNDAELVISGYTRTDAEGNPLAHGALTPGQYERFSHEEWAGRMSAAWSRLYKRDLIERYGIRFDESDKHVRGEDLPFSLFFSCMCDSIVTLAKADYFYVEREGSAMQRFRGLREIKLPYRPLLKTIRLIAKHGGPVNGGDWYEWFVLRILATFTDLSRGSTVRDVRRLEYYITRLLAEYFPDYADNPLVGRYRHIDVPLRQQAAVQTLVKATASGNLRRLLKTYCRPR